MTTHSKALSTDKTPEGLSLNSRGFQPPTGPATIPQPRRGWPMRMRGEDAFVPHPMEDIPSIGQPLRGWGHFVLIYRGFHPRLFMENRSAVNHLILPRMTNCGKCPEFFIKHEARQYTCFLELAVPRQPAAPPLPGAPAAPRLPGAPRLPAASRFLATTPEGLSLTSRGFQPPDLAATPINPGGVGQCAVSPHLSTNAHPTPR